MTSNRAMAMAMIGTVQVNGNKYTGMIAVAAVVILVVAAAVVERIKRLTTTDGRYRHVRENKKCNMQTAMPKLPPLLHDHERGLIDILHDEFQLLHEPEPRNG